MTVISRRSDYTFQYNQRQNRHGWLRLTPAYSVKLVEEITTQIELETRNQGIVLDPFSGTATTGLVVAQTGLASHLLEINPFLVWFGNTKCADYTSDELSELGQIIPVILQAYKPLIGEALWLPAIHQIERWWSKSTVEILAAMHHVLGQSIGWPGAGHAANLLWVAFCRLMIDTSAAAFNHVSMSFHEEPPIFSTQTIDLFFSEIASHILHSARQPLPGYARVFQADSRQSPPDGKIRYTHVITSPPYPNRVSYIRELRPYMYWTRFLHETSEAGELDWESIGGTWGVATSRLKEWQPEHYDHDLSEELNLLCANIEQSHPQNGLLMKQYVYKYFYDMHQHLANLRPALVPGAQLNYIVGNSSFYGHLVPTERILANSLARLGYSQIECHIVRKRNSKKELFEYCLSATWSG
jgi:hypothetical protein